VRRELRKFEMAQIWTINHDEEEVGDALRERMNAEFGTWSIPLHVIVDPETGDEIARYVYRGGLIDTDEYLEFLKKATE
jgi:hypothetical protein